MTSYNGWTNHETWCVNLWIGNDEMQAGYWQGECEEILSEYDGEYSEDNHLGSAAYVLSRRMKEQFTEEMPAAIQGMWLDLLTTAIDRCNWREIAEHIVEAVADDIDFNANAEAH
jgi:hypothetical protein